MSNCDQHPLLESRQLSRSCNIWLEQLSLESHLSIFDSYLTRVPSLRKYPLVHGWCDTHPGARELDLGPDDTNPLLVPLFSQEILSTYLSMNKSINGPPFWVSVNH